MTLESESHANDLQSAAGSSAPRRHTHALADGAGRAQRRGKSTVTVGDVRYFDGAELSRPLEMPARVRYVALAAMAVAAILGCLFLAHHFDQVTNEPLRQQQALQDNLAREVAYDLPSLPTMMAQSDEDIMASLTEAGYTLFERTPIGTNPDGGFEVIKLPADVSLEEAGAMYIKGIEKLAPADAVRLLKGSWNLTVERKNGANMRVRYADFESGTIEKAIQSAMQAEGLENATVSDSGVDDSGNTYQAGTVDTEDGVTYNWRVSAIDLSQVYEIAGLPNTAFYVGIRFTE